MNPDLLGFISDILNENVKQYTPLSGGDISAAYLLQTQHQKYFLKCNQGKHSREMFVAEKSGLEAIAATHSIKTPAVHYCGEAGNVAFLLLEYIEPKRPERKDFEKLGFQLGKLHKSSTEDFGWDQNNFIGSLPQSNNKNKNWPAFYVEERILPQLKLARSKHLLSDRDIPEDHLMHRSCQQLFPTITPSLLHGDLWGGNFLISTDGTPYLIDPAVYYGHHEVDIAMTRLFGGFDPAFYDAYYKQIPKEEGHEERCELYQLYYLLAHLNLFGASYYAGVKRILRKYF